MALCKNSYALPLDLNKITHWHKRSSEAHRGRTKHSLDFSAPEGTAVKAARSGNVVWLTDSFKSHGLSKKYLPLGNRIVIKHENSEYSAYEHMMYHSAKVKVGQKVKKGQVIAKVGNTGFSGVPHLHFEVFNNPSKDESEGDTLQVSFKIPRKARCIRSKKELCILG